MHFALSGGGRRRCGSRNRLFAIPESCESCFHLGEVPFGFLAEVGLPGSFQDSFTLAKRLLIGGFELFVFLRCVRHGL